MYFKKISVDMKDSLPQNLYITDDAETAKRLRREGEAVLVYLHDGNGEQDFSRFHFAVEDPENLDTDYVEKVYRRLKGLPWDILETDRCLIRETTPEDAEDFYRIYSAPAIARYMDDLYPDVELEKKYIQEYIDKVYAFYDFGVWTVVEKQSGAVIGRAGLSYREGSPDPEIGFVIGVPWQRKGYALEVCRAILEYGKSELGFNVIQALVEPENVASLELCKKLGMVFAETVNVNGREYRKLVRPAGAQASE